MKKWWEAFLVFIGFPPKEKPMLELEAAPQPQTRIEVLGPQWYEPMLETPVYAVLAFDSGLGPDGQFVDAIDGWPLPEGADRAVHIVTPEEYIELHRPSSEGEPVVEVLEDFLTLELPGQDEWEQAEREKREASKEGNG